MSTPTTTAMDNNQHHQFTTDMPPSLMNLPSEIIDHIAYLSTLAGSQSVDSHAGNGDNHQEGIPSNDPYSRYPYLPTTIPALLLTCRKLHSILSPRSNPSLYARIFRSRFDLQAIRRRYGDKPTTSTYLAKELQRRYMILKRIRSAVRSGYVWDREGDDTTVDPDPAADAVMEENLWLAYMMMTENDGKNLAQLKWASIDTYLALHHDQVMLSSACRPAYPPDSPSRSLALHLTYLLTDPEQLALESKDESDEKLFVLRPFVFGAHRFDAFLAPWTLRTLPVPPREQGESASEDGATTSSAAPTPTRVPAPDPVVASAPGGRPAQPVRRNPFMADLRPRTRICTVQHCGLTLQISPPLLSHAAFMTFFLKVERDPAVLQLTAILDPDPAAAPTTAQSADASISSAEPNASAAAPLTTEEEESTSTSIPADRRPSLQVSPFNRPPLSFTSHDHDADVSRLFACLDPYSSPGLHPLFYHGAFEGNWEGRFCFFDFDSYRDMLGGRMQSLYEGAFGEQPQVWKITETVVRAMPRPEGEDGSILNADFLSHSDEAEARRVRLAEEYKEDAEARRAIRQAEGSVDAADTPSTKPAVGWSRSHRARWNNAYPSTEAAHSSRTDGGMPAASVRRGADPSSDPDAYAHAAYTGRIPPDWHLYPSFSASETPSQAWLEEHPEAHEILLSGTGHSAWGRFVLRGRVRSWDGLLMITKEYRPDGRGRWLYRGYCMAGGKLVGRWRDTFTPDNMCGYEGCFLLSRRESA